jgi:hypothetical protein
VAASAPVEDRRAVQPESVKSNREPVLDKPRIAAGEAGDRQRTAGTAFVNQWIADGRGYTYTYALKLSRLFVARGVGQYEDLARP